MAVRSRLHVGRGRISRLSAGTGSDPMTSGKKTRYLDPGEIERGIQEIVALATAQQIRVALIGGAALQLLGSDRLTKDVDFVADRVLDGVVVQGTLDFGGVKAATATGVPVDLVVRDDKYRELYEAAVGAASRVEGVPVPVVGPEYLIAMKMVAGRPKDDADLEFLIADSGADPVRTRAVVEEHLGPYAVDELERYRDEVAWRRRRDAD